MTLGFSLYHDKAKKHPTHFPERVIKSIDGITEYQQSSLLKVYKWHDVDYPFDPKVSAKKHTIRVDKSNRWRKGMKIHPVINNRTKNRFQFAPEMTCTGVERIFMSLHPQTEELEISAGDSYLYYPEKEKLATNDGFDSYEDFEKWFHKILIKEAAQCLSARIIHWTDVRYER